MGRYIRLFILVALSLSFVACGAESSDGYTPTTDTVSTTGLVTFTANSIRIVTKGPTVQSEIIEDCSISFASEDLSYALISADELVLGGETFEYVRPLSSPSTAANADERLFAVWKGPSQTVREVTYNIEIEIRGDSIIYRNTCVR